MIIIGAILISVAIITHGVMQRFSFLEHEIERRNTELELLMRKFEHEKELVNDAAPRARSKKIRSECIEASG